MDDSNSLIGFEHTNSRTSLADTSVTSTGDLSAFSTMTRSNIHESSLDVNSNTSDKSIEEKNSIGSGIIIHSMRESLPNSSGMKDDLNIHKLKIFVPYSPIESSTTSPQNGDLYKCLSSPYSESKIRIKIENDELQTPVVEDGQIKNLFLDTPEVDLK